MCSASRPCGRIAARATARAGPFCSAASAPRMPCMPRWSRAFTPMPSRSAPWRAPTWTRRWRCRLGANGAPRRSRNPGCWRKTRWIGRKFFAYERPSLARLRHCAKKIPRMCIDSGAGTKENHAHPAVPIRCRREGGHPTAGFPAFSPGAVIMRYRLIALFSAVFSVLAAFCIAAMAEEAKNDVKGLFLLTDYPAVTLRPGTTSTINLKLQNYGLPPERLALSVGGVPSGWTVTLVGGGQPVAAALAATNANVPLELRLDVPKDAPIGTTNLTVTARGAASNATLPIEVKLATDLPAKLTLNPQLPELRGTSKSSFEFQLAIKNDSPKKVLVSLSAQAPQNFDATYTEQYGSQELNALPLDPGQSKDVKLKVRPPNTVAAGKYNVAAKVSADDATATSDLVLDITGQAKIDIAGREGVLSAKASAGQEASIPVILTNSGTAPAEQIELSGTVPPGWKVNFEPKTVDRIAPNENKEVKALVTPSDKAVAGDYVTTVRAAARGESASQTFRVAVTTSTIWGIVGIALIGGALLVMIGAVVWFGRR